MAIKFEFTHRDDNKIYAHDKSAPLVNFILSHIDFLPHLCDCITTYTEVGCLDRVDEKERNLFNKYINSLDFNNEENYDYIEEFGEIFRVTYNIDDIDDDYKQAMLGEIRGKILEDLLEKFVQPRYIDRSRPFGKLFSTGCEIKLNGSNLTLPGRKTVDIAGWDGIKGEFYEAKVNPFRIDEEVLSLLTLVKNKLDKLQVKAIVGCVCMLNTETIIAYIEEVKSEMKTSYNNNIEVFGKNNLLELKEGPLALSA